MSRCALGWDKIRSDLYDVRNVGGQLIFSGRGSGHGVGLCQAGAEEMAREGKTYRDILNFYYPGTELVSAHAQNWQKQSSERLDLLSTNPQADAAILPVADRILTEDERAIGWQLAFRPQLEIFPTMDSYRDTTGQPGWVAASVRGQTIRLQPLIELQRRSIVESTLRHEFFHLLVESRAKPGTPLWFREGIVLYLSNPDAPPVHSPAMTDEQMESSLRRPAGRDNQENAYAAAQNRVTVLVQLRGRQTVLEWLATGIPADVSAGAPQ
jgi:stage II sporulation protein D